MERMIGIEPTTDSLEDCDSATELHPHTGAESSDRTNINGFSDRRMNHHCYLSEILRRLSGMPSLTYRRAFIGLTSAGARASA